MMEWVRDLDMYIYLFPLQWFVYWDDKGGELMCVNGICQGEEYSYVGDDMSA